jgi:tripartite-type tricarboxylate transporter receptor subunit TctC
MPPAIVTRINDELDAALKTPRVAAQIEKLLLNPTPMKPQEFRNRVEKDYEIFRRITTAAGIQPE